jgi:hypothetical protein
MRDENGTLRRSPNGHHGGWRDRAWPPLVRWLRLAGARDLHEPPAPPEFRADPAGALARLIDEAHAALPTPDLAELLLAVTRAIEPLGRGRRPAAPRPGSLPPAGRASPAVRVYLRPIRVALDLGARHDGRQSEEALRRLHARLLAHIEEVAARPRGAVVLPS